MPHFVVLHHVLPAGGARSSHWDLMLEADGELLTWALDEPPELSVRMSHISAQQLAAHRLDYLDYEGEVSGGRGRVTRWDRGTFDCLENSPGRYIARLHGVRLCGVATLVQCEDDPQRWIVSLAAELADDAGE